jgi:hypothetical protein
MVGTGSGASTSSRRNRRALHAAATLPEQRTIADETPILGLGGSGTMPPRPPVSPVLLALGWLVVVGALIGFCLTLLALLGIMPQVAPLVLPLACLLLILLVLTLLGVLVTGEGGFGARSVLVIGSVALGLLIIPQWSGSEAQLLVFLLVLAFVGLFLGYQLLPQPTRAAIIQFVDELMCAVNQHSWAA